jgi:hypothetical protein
MGKTLTSSLSLGNLRRKIRTTNGIKRKVKAVVAVLVVCVSIQVLQSSNENQIGGLLDEQTTSTTLTNHQMSGLLLETTTLEPKDPGLTVTPPSGSRAAKMSPAVPVQVGDYFDGTEYCPIESLVPKTTEFLYFQQVAKTNHELAVAARRYSKSPRSSDKIPAAALASSEPRIPHRLIFTHKYNLFDNCETSTARDYTLTPTLHMMAANARQTVALYRDFWEEPAAEVVFLTDIDCIRVLNATEPRLLKYFKKEEGMYKADMCRVADLLLHGGYYFDVDLLAVHPVSPSESVGFSTVRGSNWPKFGFFQAFTACAPGHPILQKSLDIMLEVYQGKRRRQGWIGPATMQIAYEQYLNETLPEEASRDLLLLDEIALKYVQKKKKKKRRPDYMLGIPQQPFPRDGFRRQVCNYVVYDNTTQYFYSRVNGTHGCGGIKTGSFPTLPADAARLTASNLFLQQASV